MKIEQIKCEIEETLCDSILYGMTPFDIDNYICSLGACSIFEDLTLDEFKDSDLPSWYFPMLDKWLALEKAYQDDHQIQINNVVEL